MKNTGKYNQIKGAKMCIIHTPADKHYAHIFGSFLVFNE